MAFPTTSVIDQFTGTNGDDLPVYSANWQSTLAGLSAIEIQGNAATGSAVSNCIQFWATNYGPDSEAYATISTPPGGSSYVGLFTRSVQETSISTLDGYSLVYVAGSLYCYRVDNGVSTLLGASISQTVSAGDAIGIESVGSTHTIYYKASGGSWTSLGTRTDSTYSAAGKPGLSCNNTTVRIDDFGAGTINQFLTPGLFTNTQTFYAPTVGRGAVSVAPSLVTNSQTFHAATVSASYGLTTGLLTNSQTFYGPTISTGAVTLSPSLVTNGQTFYAPTVSSGSSPQTLEPSLVTNSQTFYGPVVSYSYTLAPELLTNSQTFHAATVSAQNTLSTSLLTNAQTFYGPTVSVGAVTLQPSLVANDQTFYGPVVSQASNVELLPELLTNEQTFFGPTVGFVVVSVGGGGTGGGGKSKRKKLAVLEVDGKEYVIPAQDVQAFLNSLVKPDKKKAKKQQVKIPVPVVAPEVRIVEVAPEIETVVVQKVDKTNELLLAAWNRAIERELEDEEELIWLLVA